MIGVAVWFSAAVVALGDAPSRAPAAPPPAARVDSLFAHVDLLVPESGFPNGSRRFLLTAQSGERNDGDERMRLWLPPSGSLLSGPLEADEGARLECGVGCEFFDSAWPAEGSGAAPPAGPRIVTDFAVEWVAATAGAPAIALLDRSVVFEPGGAADGRVRVDLACDLPASARGAGRLRFRATRREGPPAEISILPTLWGPRLIHRAPVAPPAATRRTREEVVVDLLDPRFAAGRGGEPSALGVVTTVDRDAAGLETARHDEPLRRPLVGVEAHFETGAGDELPRGGREPALAFAASGRARFELDAEELAGARLLFEPGFAQFTGSGGEVLDPARAAWRVCLDGRELASGALETPTRHEACGWGEPVVVPLAPGAAALKHALELQVELAPFAKPAELVLSREPLADDGKAGATRERRLALRAPWFGLGRPRIVRSREVVEAAATPAAPNVLFVCIETLRADEVGFGVGTRDTTPFLARLAPRALVFSQASSPAPWTLPSVASYLTALHPSEHGARSELADVVPERLTTLAEAAALRAGARTFACVTNDLLKRESGFAAGFDSFGPFAYANAAAVRRLFLDWQSEAPELRFFAYLHLFEPHVPLNAPGWMREEFVPERLRGRPLAADVKRVTQTMWKGGDARAAASELDFLRGRYRGEIRFADRQLELLFAELARRGLLERTVVVVTGDHGEEFGDHRWFGHGSQLYEESIHVPLLLYGAGIPAARVDLPVESLLASRIAAAALGLTPFGSEQLPAAAWPVRPSALEEALADAAVVSTTEKVIDVQSRPWPEKRSELAARFEPRLGRVVRIGDAKAIFTRPPARRLEPPGPGDALELFDLARDPGELAPMHLPWSEAAAGRFARFAALLAEERARDAAIPTSELPADTLEVLRKLGYLGPGADDR
jgi:hypothetical protein